jgi:hypothetical protein
MVAGGKLPLLLLFSRNSCSLGSAVLAVDVDVEDPEVVVVFDDVVLGEDDVDELPVSLGREVAETDGLEDGSGVGIPSRPMVMSPMLGTGGSSGCL